MKTPFILAESARIRGGKISAWHTTGCKALAGGPCSCGSVEYTIVRLEAKR